jgi:cell division protein FtsN
MDLAVYISELLGLHGEVNVPEIGYFAQVRTNGYYNKDENKFYPPAHDISFQPQFTDDDSLARYISTKKNISPASSKYFIEKYINDVKKRAATQMVDIAGLGQLHTLNSTLAFKANETSRENDPAFYGFQPVKVYKISEQSADVYTPPIKEPEIINEIPVEKEERPEEIFVDQNVNIPTVIQEQEQLHEQVYAEDEESPGRFRNLWVVILLVVAIVALSLVAIYQYYPTAFDRIINGKEQGPAVKPVANPATQPATKTDTVSTAKQDSAAKAVAVPAESNVKTIVDTFAVTRYELQAGAFRTLPRTEVEMHKYEKMGLQPKIVKHAPGKLLKITLGTYFSQKDAQRVKDSILSKHKITISLQPYLPKRK